MQKDRARREDIPESAPCVLRGSGGLLLESATTSTASKWIAHSFQKLGAAPRTVTFMKTRYDAVLFRTTNINARCRTVCVAYKARGVTSCAFGDIFLANLRLWRGQNLALIDLRGVFPIWKVASNELIQEFITGKFGSVVCCTNDAYLDESFVGKNIDADFVASLPIDVDPLR
jgi:diphthamide synthase (EF-2-diphthine--ammonia ligase)